MSATFRVSKRGRVYQDKDRKHSKAARSCLHGGSCPYCQGNRHHAAKRAEPIDPLAMIGDSWLAVDIDVGPEDNIHTTEQE